jgi:voltage-gated potassium channel
MSTQRRLQMMQASTTRTCHECLSEGHASDANFCAYCSARLPGYQNDSRSPKAPVPGAT